MTPTDQELAEQLRIHSGCQNLHCGDSSRCWNCDGCRQQLAADRLASRPPVEGEAWAALSAIMREYRHRMGDSPEVRNALTLVASPPDAELEGVRKALEAAVSMIEDLMERHDYVGTGNSRSAALELREDELRLKPIREALDRLSPAIQGDGK